MQEIRLRCVECGDPGLRSGKDVELRCPACGHVFLRHPQGNIPILIGGKSRLKLEEIIELRTAPQKIDLEIAQRHWNTGNLIQLLESCSGKVLLNYGSGDGGDRKWLEARGYEVTSFDIYPGDYTDYVCDGHDLPFADEQFEIVTSTAVFEHLHHPFDAAEEIYRVLKPGGAHVGSVAFLEPFHADSYFHMSHLGLTEVFRSAGFSQVEVHPGWSFAEALNSKYWLWNQVGLVRKFTMPWHRFLFRIGQKLWKWGYSAKGRELPPRITLGFCGSLMFKAVK